jgi:DNA processing protein
LKILPLKIPESLKKIKSPPKELFYQGDTSLLEKPKVAIVGTRKASQYTKQSILSISRELSKIGIVVVSGGALGTDISAHRGAFPNTISIMANSLDIIYPKTNSDLIKQMAEKSLIISESEFGVPAHPKRFINRNRLIIGISDFVIIGEADSRSGTSQSMRIAREMGKEIFVLSHRMGESAETNLYLKTGWAKGIFNLDNFIDEIKNRYGVKEDLLSIADKEDPFLEFCKTNPTYEELFSKFGDEVFEYELDGKFEVIGGRVHAI